ncbi:hypothetical protein LOTGIDRAFT_162106 [Lottia gigantea]|uniref:Uncharacterized protein n=1 Tax=Lottia gigantea TaxID=225164 RepID=V4A8L1_LOTGI|nr:hypothetical protein LOTGIDRAFT_162106 [Lottia gigantea]ESO93082.1 hypothetical protein LOTGIDRAFT_162106 [Lottia gigantea]
MPTGKTTQVTKISSSSRTVTQTVSSVQGRVGLQQSFEEISSPSRKLFLENASLRMSPGWVSGHGSLFESPKSIGSPSPMKPPKARRSSVYVKKSLVVASSVDSFKKPPVFISPTGVKTRARRSSIYQKSGKNLLTGLDPKARRDSLAAIRSKKLVSESDYVFAVPTADSAKRKKLVSKSSRAKKAAEPKRSPKKASSKSQAKSNSPVKKSSKKINLVDSNSLKKSTHQNIKVILATSSPKKEKTVRSKAKAKTPVKEVELADDDDDDIEDDIEDDDILSPRRTRKTPGKSRKRSLTTVTKSAKKRKRSPSRSPSPSPKKKGSPKKTSSETKKSSSSIKKRKATKDSPNSSATKSSLEVSLTPLEVDESFSFKLSDSDRKKLTKNSKTPSKSTPQKSTKSTIKQTPKSSAKKISTKKTPSSTKRISLSFKADLPNSSEKKSKSKKSIAITTDEVPVAKVLEFKQATESFDIEVEEDISMATIQTSPKSKTPLTSQKMKSILDSVSVPNETDKKRKTTDFVEPQSANKRRRYDMEKFEKIVASTPRDMRLDILSGRRPELSPIPGTVNKNINNSFSSSKQVTIFSDKSTFLSAGPSNLSPVASKSPLIISEVVKNQVYTDFVDGNDDDDDDFDYSHISLSQKPTEPEPYLYDYDSDLDISHSNVQAGCTIL